MIRKGYNELLNFIGEDYTVFGTLTFRHRQTFEQAEKTLQHFWKCIDRIFFGNASYRKNIRTKRTNVIQQGISRQNTHIHFVAKTVKGFKTNDFIAILEFVWKTKINTAGLVQIEEIQNARATSKYLLHEFNTIGSDTLSTSTNI